MDTKRIYEEYVAGAGQRGIISRLAASYGVSRQRIWAIVKAAEADHGAAAIVGSSVLTDKSLDMLVQIIKTTGNHHAPQLVEAALAQYIEHLKQQAEYRGAENGI